VKYLSCGREEERRKGRKRGREMEMQTRVVVKGYFGWGGEVVTVDEE